MRRTLVWSWIFCAFATAPAAAQEPAPGTTGSRVVKLADAATAHAAWDAGLVWVARGTGELLRVDVTTGAERGTRLQLDGTPQHVAVHGDWVLVTCRRHNAKPASGPPDVVHVIRRVPDVVFERSIPTTAPIGVASLDADRVAIVGAKIQVVAPATGKVLQTLDAGAGTVNGFHASGGRLCVSKQRPGRLACFSGSPLALRFDNPGYKWITGVRIDGDRAFVSLMTPQPGFGVFDLRSGAFTNLSDEARLLPAVTDGQGQRWGIRASGEESHVELVTVDAECRPGVATAVPGLRSPWPTLLHVDARRAVIHTLRQGTFRFDRQ